MSYFYDPDVGGYYYGPGHPMKPHRVRMAHSLVLRYGLHNAMEVGKRGREGSCASVACGVFLFSPSRHTPWSPLPRPQMYRPRPASPSDVATFHAPDYVDFLQRVAPGNTEELAADVARYAHGDDCPIFPGLWPYCALYAGGSIGGAVTLNHGAADVAINWAGGLHHAKKAEASGFCYVNDIVLAILELLKHHDR